jgi:hypothetical protein
MMRRMRVMAASPAFRFLPGATPLQDNRREELLQPPEAGRPGHGDQAADRQVSTGTGEVRVAGERTDREADEVEAWRAARAQDLAHGRGQVFFGILVERPVVAKPREQLGADRVSPPAQVHDPGVEAGAAQRHRQGKPVGQIEAQLVGRDAVDEEDGFLVLGLDRPVAADADAPPVLRGGEADLVREAGHEEVPRREEAGVDHEREDCDRDRRDREDERHLGGPGGSLAPPPGIGRAKY